MKFHVYNVKYKGLKKFQIAGSVLQKYFVRDKLFGTKSLKQYVDSIVVARRDSVHDFKE